MRSLLQGPTVRIHTGSPGCELVIHRNLLCHHIPWLNVVLGDDIVDFTLGPWSAGCMALFAQWLYQGDITYDIPDQGPVSVPILDLFFLATELHAPTLANLALDHFRRVCNERVTVPQAVNIENIYARTDENSPMRLLVARMVAHYMLTCDPQDTTEDCRMYMGLVARHEQFRVDYLIATQYLSIENGLQDPTKEETKDIYQEAVAPSREDSAWARAMRQNGSRARASASVPSTPPPIYSIS
ncbi:hypothetical protein MMC16_001008 [Acarospora aff. strigata]|nr:hypothetical protein [Acarospora aff. strigata]